MSLCSQLYLELLVMDMSLKSASKLSAELRKEVHHTNSRLPIFGYLVYLTPSCVIVWFEWFSEVDFPVKVIEFFVKVSTGAHYHSTMASAGTHSLPCKRHSTSATSPPFLVWVLPLLGPLPLPAFTGSIAREAQKCLVTTVQATPKFELALVIVSERSSVFHRS